MLRGREAVRADHRLRTDEKAIRTQSVILYKNYPKPFYGFNDNRVLVRMFSIRTKTRFARAARKTTRRMRQRL